MDQFWVDRNMLKRDGRVLVFEIHPFAYLLEEGFHLPDVGFQSEDLGPDNVMSYFEKGPHSYKDGLDYIGGEKYAAKTCYWFMHKLSDILNALLKSNIELLEMNEYAEELANNPTAKQLDRFPLSYMLVGKKS